MDQRTYEIEGMTCGHCRAVVASAVGALQGVAGAAVDPEADLLVVRGEGLDDDAVAAAVSSAGYAVR